MFIGHYAVGLGAKRIAPQVSLGVAFAATQLIDLIWPVFVLLGIERVEIAPGDTAATPLAFVHYPWTHSLAAVLGWGLLAGLAYAAWKRDARGALVVGALVPGHWLLDLLVHRPDLPLWPGGPVVGLGLWNAPAAAQLLELALLAAGVGLYVRSTRPLDRIGRWGLAALVGTLLAIHVANALGPPPPDADAVAFAGLALWLFVAWAAWADAHREPREASVAPAPQAG